MTFASLLTIKNAMRVKKIFYSFFNQFLIAIKEVRRKEFKKSDENFSSACGIINFNSKL